jgi:hypothetical protein
MAPEPARRGRRRLAAAAILLACAPPALAKINEIRVTLAVPMRERIDVSSMHTVLVTQLIVTQETREVDLGRELVASLRRDFHNHTTLQPVGDPAPALPEEPLKDLLANTGFWRRLADKYGADLIVAGETSYRTADRSGFQEVDAISPVTGQRIRRTVMVQREAFLLDLRLFFLRGSTGELLYEDHYNTETTRDGMGYDRLATLIDLYEQMSNDILAVVSPQPQTVQRTIFSE